MTLFAALNILLWQHLVKARLPDFPESRVVYHDATSSDRMHVNVALVDQPVHPLSREAKRACCLCYLYVHCSHHIRKFQKRNVARNARMKKVVYIT